MEDEPLAKKVRRSRWGQAPEEAPTHNQMELVSVSHQQQGHTPVAPHMQGVMPGAMVPGGTMVPPAGLGMPAGMMVPMNSLTGAMMPQFTHMDLGAAAQAAREALEKAKKAAMFQKQIQEQMLRLKGGAQVGAASGQQFARKLILDEFGRELTEEGKVLPMKPQVVSTLMVNQNKLVEKDAQKILMEEKKKAMRAVKDAGASKWFDNDLKTAKGKTERRQKAFKFVEKDHFVKQEQKMQQIMKEREKQRLEGKEAKENTKIDEKKGPDGKGAEKKEEKPVVNIEKLKSVTHSTVPLVEWWDRILIQEVTDANTPYVLKKEKVSHLIEHPVPIKPIGEKQATHTMHLTPQERKKLRRLRRQERTQQIRDKIKMGIIQPPPPKVKMSNLMRVLGDEAIADPSLVERKVKMQIEQRKKEHEARNEMRKLPETQKSAKKKQKWIEKNKDSVHVSLYKIKELTGKRCLFKIEMNAQQFQLTGACIICPGIGNLVVVEGGARAIKRYKKLMTKRIKWKEDRKDDEESDEEDEEEQEDNQDCVCIWEGIIQERNFKNWKSQTCKTDDEARKVLKEKKVEHYWDMLHRFRNVRDDI